MLGEETARDRGHDAGPVELPGQDTLVPGVGIGVEEADGHGLGPGLPELPEDTPDLVPGNALLDATRSQRPLVNPERTLLGEEEEALLGLEAVELSPGLTADEKDILETRGRDQGNPPALSLKESIDGHGRAVDDECLSMEVEEIGQTVKDGQGRIPGRGKDFPVEDPAFFPDDEIGEGAAGIHSDADGQRSLGMT